MVLGVGVGDGLGVGGVGLGLVDDELLAERLAGHRLGDRARRAQHDAVGLVGELLER